MGIFIRQMFQQDPAEEYFGVASQTIHGIQQSITVQEGRAVRTVWEGNLLLAKLILRLYILKFRQNGIMTATENYARLMF